MIQISDIFLFALFCIIIATCEMLVQGILTLDILLNIFSENVTVYLLIAGGFLYMRRHQIGIQNNNNNNLERSILVLNNELQKMYTENEWKYDVKNSE